MILSLTGRPQAGRFAPIVLRGGYGEMIPAAAAIGYDAMELHIRDAVEVDRDELRGLFERSGITLSSIGTGAAFVEDQLSLSSPDEGNRQAAIKRILDHIDLASEYGAAVIIGTIKGLVKLSSSREVCLATLEKSMRLLLERAEERRTMLVFEVINRYESDYFNTIEETAAFVDGLGSRWIKLHIDTFHMNIEETDIGAAIRKAGGRIGHVHIADSDRWYAGHGHYDFAGTVRALKDVGYDGVLAVESYMFPDPETSARETLATLKKLI